MGQADKLLKRVLGIPKDLRYEELERFLKMHGFKKIEGAGSRVKFCDKDNNIIGFHKPHPSNVVKEYVIKQVIRDLAKYRKLEID